MLRFNELSWSEKRSQQNESQYKSKISKRDLCLKRGAILRPQSPLTRKTLYKQIRQIVGK